MTEQRYRFLAQRNCELAAMMSDAAAARELRKQAAMFLDMAAAIASVSEAARAGLKEEASHPTSTIDPCAIQQG